MVNDARALKPAIRPPRRRSSTVSRWSTVAAVTGIMLVVAATAVACQVGDDARVPRASSPIAAQQGSKPRDQYQQAKQAFPQVTY